MSRIDQTVEINTSIEACYTTLLQFERFPEFLPPVRHIEPTGNANVWRWHISSTNNAELEWDLELLGVRHQHYTISWHTVRNSDVAHSGAVTLHPLNQDRTQLRLVVEYTPYSIVSPSEQTVEQEIENCLQALKADIEHGAGVPETLNKM